MAWWIEPRQQSVDVDDGGPDDIREVSSIVTWFIQPVDRLAPEEAIHVRAILDSGSEEPIIQIVINFDRFYF